MPSQNRNAKVGGMRGNRSRGVLGAITLCVSVVLCFVVVFCFVLFLRFWSEISTFRFSAGITTSETVNVVGRLNHNQDGIGVNWLLLILENKNGSVRNVGLFALGRFVFVT